ncbi:MAG: hypothetical protein H5T59_00285, partial [Anaerolineae bacterium]|nr:hypothetical protein [Anaerolineae bacterium]
MAEEALHPKDVEGPVVPDQEAQAPQEAEAPAAPEPQAPEAVEGDLAWWRDRALRLQAEMENFRKRQQRLAEEQIRADR